MTTKPDPLPSTPEQGGETLPDAAQIARVQRAVWEASQGDIDMTDDEARAAIAASGGAPVAEEPQALLRDVLLMTLADAAWMSCQEDKWQLRDRIIDICNGPATALAPSPGAER
jgi:hypothetical protein